MTVEAKLTFLSFAVSWRQISIVCKIAATYRHTYSFWISLYKCFFDLNINVTAPRSKYKPTWVFSLFRTIILLCVFDYQQRPFWRLFHGYRKQKQSKIWICITANVKLGSGRRRSWLEKLNISGNAKTLHKLNLREFLFTLERIFKVIEQERIFKVIMQKK